MRHRSRGPAEGAGADNGAEAVPVIRVTEIGEYIRHHSCERRFKLELDNRRLAREVPFAERLFNPLDPVLQESGRARENAWETSLREGGLLDLTDYASRPEDSKQVGWTDFLATLARVVAGQPAYGREVQVSGEIGSFRLEGRIDFVVLQWRDGRPVLRLVECKASRRDRTYHRIQVAIYGMLVRALVAASRPTVGGVALEPGDIECVVARIDETTNESQQILALPAIDLEMEEADILRLLAEDGVLQRIRDSDLSTLDFQLGEKCDGCVFNVNCFPECGRERRLELLAIEPSSTRALRSAGVQTIDDLATLDLDSEPARHVRRDPGFNESLPHLVLKAQARRRTLVDGDVNPDEYEVSALPNSGHGQLPPHTMNGARLVRIYLCVDYDYSENRIGSLAAHVTSSEGQVDTTFQIVDGRYAPDPVIRERVETGVDDTGRTLFAPRELVGRTIVEFIPAEWTGRYDVDSGVEKQLIQSFFQKLVDEIAQVAGTPEVPIHFYVWSRSEVARLVEACSRVSSRLLTHLRELLGCRESLEQLLYSCLQDEVERRYALGWTGRGLAVVSSLRWYGRRYHWTRQVAGQTVAIDRVFTQDIFDFKTDLDLKADGSWEEDSARAARRHKFEIRSRFHDSLTAPYWRAYWRTLPPARTAGMSAAVWNAIGRYNQAAQPGVLRAYLAARTHALRWVEENVRFKNEEIQKPPMRVADLPSFELGVDTAARASIDFLRLDQHVNVTDWISRHLIPPADRVGGGRTIPVSDVFSNGNGDLSATINLDGFDIDIAALRNRCSIAEGSFVRLSPADSDPRRGQTFGQLMRGGRTCRVDSISWDTGQVTLKALYIPASRYMLFSSGANETGNLFDAATIDESPSDFVAGRVEQRLQSGRGTHVFDWFDPEDPRIPEAVALEPDNLAQTERMLRSFTLPSGRPLADDQIASILDGLGTTVQLLQGPPGTGKTMTTAVSTLARIAARRRVGDIVVLCAHTHTAVDTLLRRIDEISDAFRQHALAHGLALPNIRLAKVHTSHVEDPVGGRIQDFVSKPSVRFINGARGDAVLVVGGTTGALLKMAEELSQRSPFRDDPVGFRVPTLVVDEASMMVFPHFLALSTLMNQDGEVLLAGDHRQLAPIVAHDWEREDRPPAVLYQPFASAYQAIQNLSTNPGLTERAVRRSALTFSFRLPPVIRDLIARLYRLDDIQLEGLPRAGVQIGGFRGSTWESVWHGETGLFLVLHSERQSRQSNELEAAIIQAILTAGGRLPNASVAVMTPHRAQRSLLKSTLRLFASAADVIDTVERLQGGERPTVIVSATASDPTAISSNVEFVLDLNRSNVAFSRAKDRLIVVCSDSLLDHVPAELEHYDSALLWKSLRAICSRQIGEVPVNGFAVRIFTPAIEMTPDTPVP
jgi:AAA domain/PD-(D/E)XK nuclease superfamily